jgi:hypothetical protein
MIVQVTVGWDPGGSRTIMMPLHTDGSSSDGTRLARLW